MRIEQLEYLLELSRHSSINMASDKLHISHQSLSKSLKSLEIDLDTTLLERSTQGIVFTEHGKKTIEATKAILNILDDLKAQIQLDNAPNKTNLLKGPLAIAAAPAFVQSNMTCCLQQYKKSFPNVNLSIFEADPGKIFYDIDEKNYDIGISNISQQSVDFLQQTLSINCDILQVESSFVLCGKSSKLASRSYLTIKTLLKHPLIFYNSHHWLAQTLSQYGQLINCLYTNNMNICFNNVADGSHLTIVSASLYNNLDSEQKNLVVKIPLKEKISSVLVVITPNHQPLSKQSLAFITMLKSIYTSH